MKGQDLISQTGRQPSGELRRADCKAGGAVLPPGPALAGIRGRLCWDLTGCGGC